eukprot:Gregarina_sp_Pseudo_9__3646@NODE_379_length_3002_cov_25_137023_g358_i0_p2_GENE_NODE_379_length_3002_cov_25_137023_g358_i0NODE_379_length_3002_cov_25_137023_g358_i0_p2_ORF_typecomplete_len339_score47_02Aldo_ket_red/PF00248_21/9e49Luteo_PO/PF04662_13/0_025_NODE_379_length_3002_cov_25_137023_g358_i019402956
MSMLCARMHNGVLIPAVGFGTWRLANSSETADITHEALRAGYRHLDCAIVYHNQEQVCKALERYDPATETPSPAEIPDTAEFKNVPVAEFEANFTVPHANSEHFAKSKGIFVTSKVFTDTFTPDGVRWSVTESTKQLGRPIDLVLLHWPVPNTKTLSYEELKNPELAPVRLECWRTLEELYAEGKVRAIGISNFMEKQLVHLISDVQRRKRQGDNKATIPMINQIEISPFCSPRKSLWEVMKRHKILTTAYSTLGPKENSIFKDEVIGAIAKRLGRSPYQVVLRWALQCGYLIIPRSSDPAHMKDNLQLDFELDDDALDQMAARHSGARDGRDPTPLA